MSLKKKAPAVERP